MAIGSAVFRSLPRNSLAWLLRQREMDSRVVAGLAIAAPVLLVVTVLMFRDLDGRGWTSSTSLRLILLADVCYMLILIGLIALRIAAVLAARREKSAGSGLHIRVVGVFILCAATPAIAVGMFATLTVNFGLEKWSSDRVLRVIENSVEVAEAYKREHTTAIQRDAEEIAALMNNAAERQRSDLLGGVLLRESQARDITRAYVVNGFGDILLQGANSRRYNFIPPGEEMLRRAVAGEPLTVFDSDNAEIRAMLPLAATSNGFLYLARGVDAAVLLHADRTRETARVYGQLESERDQVLFTFGLLYVCIAAFITLVAAFVGFWFADRLVAPIGRLAAAAQRVGSGDLNVRVQERAGDDDDDDIAALGRVFNRMTEQVGQQQDRLVRAREDMALRMQFIEKVLAGVPAGVIGVDGDGRIEIANQAAADILERPELAQSGDAILRTFSEVAPALAAARQHPRRVAEDSVQVTVGGKRRNLILRVAAEQVDNELRGFVVIFVDITDQVATQRLAAWGESARCIAHEIRNPLTPMQLAAEQLRDEIRVQDERDQELLSNYTGAIVRGVQAISKLVQDFSSLAQSPKPQLNAANVRSMVEETVSLERSANRDIEYSVSGPEDLMATFDQNLLSGAVTNLLKNAALAARERQGNSGSAGSGMAIAVRLGTAATDAWVEVEDNGVGFPKEHRERLLEPYQSAREGGAGQGLGLAIVRRAIEAHGGSIQLLDARHGTGALVRLQFPLTAAAPPTAPAANASSGEAP